MLEANEKYRKMAKINLMWLKQKMDLLACF
jgi:hypothetical protein